MANELHARPYPTLSAPCHAVFLTIKHPHDAANRDRGLDRAHLLALLESMDRRADLQLRLRRSVEGLSVVAISYYAVNLVIYLLYLYAKMAGQDKSTVLAVDHTFGAAAGLVDRAPDQEVAL